MTNGTTKRSIGLLCLGLAATVVPPAQTEIVLHSFTDGADGAKPNGVVRDAAGNLYGTTSGGGNTPCPAGCGTEYQLDSSGNETLLYSFTGADGANPTSSLIRDAACNLYGTTNFRR